MKSSLGSRHLVQRHQGDLKQDLIIKMLAVQGESGNEDEVC